VSESTEQLYDSIHEWLSGQYFGGELNYYAGVGVVVLATLVVAAVAHLIAKLVLVGIIRRIVSRTRTKWDDFLVERRFFTRIAHLVPAIIIYFSTEFFPESWWTPVERFASGYIVLITTLVVISFLNALIDIYDTLEISRSNPIKGFVQGAKLFVYIVGGIFLVSALLGRDPWGLVAGIGAVTAVLLLVFKDSILGLVASIQIITNDLVHLGDWVEMPQYGADGDVVDITLTTIKIQNFDNTITTVPTYAIISESFKNWRGMQESGGRRIKRSIRIDMSSIQFLTEEMLQRFGKFELLAPHIRTRQNEVALYNTEHNIDTSEVINGRRLTNLGTFRAYLKAFLAHHRMIHPDMTLMVRHLAPTESGLPVEIYAFSKDKVWVNYEEIQADIFDHILAVIPEFGLRVFQNPSGSDLSRVIDAAAARR
jgi:miniconductance mechanosensitive channel